MRQKFTDKHKMLAYIAAAHGSNGPEEGILH